jgi:putative spermidine/putrescine transport system ATP-binding protein
VSPSALEVTGLAAPFGPAPGLSAVSFDVSPGERLVIVGGSGAGKTTLLRAVAGLGIMSAGRVRIGGRDVTAEPPERRDAVYLHQTPLLFPHLSVAENVAFPLRVRGISEPEVARRTGEALAAVQLEELSRRAPRTLSGGQHHRVALARAVVARPTALLLDEPLSALDPTLREEVRASLLSLQHTYRPAIVLVTHDLDEAGLIADRIAVLLDGQLVQTAAPGDLFRRPVSLAVARFLGIPNQVPGEVHADGRFESVLGIVVPEASLPVGPAVAVFGPDALALAGSGPRAVVVGLQYRPRETTAIVQIGGLSLELQVDSSAVPAVGAAVSLALRTAGVTILSGRPRSGPPARS